MRNALGPDAVPGEYLDAMQAIIDGTDAMARPLQGRRLLRTPAVAWHVYRPGFNARLNAEFTEDLIGAPLVSMIIPNARRPVIDVGVRSQTMCRSVPPPDPGERCVSTKLPGVQKLLSRTSHRTTPGFDQS
jgi:hypothetical protein